MFDIVWDVRRASDGRRAAAAAARRSVQSVRSARRRNTHTHVNVYKKYSN